jgi:hypothetical protein
MSKTPINRIIPSTKKLRHHIKSILNKYGVTIVKSKTRRCPPYYPGIPREIYARHWDYHIRVIDYTLEADDYTKIENSIKAITVIIGLLGIPYNPPRHNLWNSKALKQSFTFFAYMED